MLIWILATGGGMLLISLAAGSITPREGGEKISLQRGVKQTHSSLPPRPFPQSGPLAPLTYWAVRAAKHRWLHTVEGSPSKGNGWTLDSPKDVSEIQISWT